MGDAPKIESTEKVSRGSIFSTHRGDSMTVSDSAKLTAHLVSTWEQYLRRSAPVPTASSGTMDETDSQGWNALKQAYTLGQPNMSDALFQWFGTQSFIGHQACGIFAQHWMIDKICTVPVQDALRMGYEITNDAGESELKPEVIAAYAHYDKKFNIRGHMLDYGRKGRIFGIRVAIPIIESADPDYYEKAFNPDGVRPGSFKGWTLVDPYWMSPILSSEASSKPIAPDFYEPTWWLIDGKRYHRTHLCIFRTDAPADILKPAYLYSGVPLPQKIMERVYAAERTANEAPLLTLTKRLMTYKLDDIEAAMADKSAFDAKMQQALQMQDNYARNVIGKDDEIEQIDTSLADLNELIQGQYALACAAGGVPVNKVMGTAAGGLSNEGAYDESNYHESLESLQTLKLSPFLERHHLLVKMSYIVPMFGASIGGVNTVASWAPLDSPTAKEWSEIWLNKSTAAANFAATGAIDDVDINNMLRNSRESDYSTIRPITESRAPVDGEEDDGEDDKPTVPMSKPNSAATGD